jgi:outer membrane protein assembly factor BamA
LQVKSCNGYINIILGGNLMKKILSIALTAVMLTSLSIPVAADAPAFDKKTAASAAVALVRTEAPASTNLSGTIYEVNEQELLFTTAEGVKYTVPIISLKGNENYKKMALKAGDPIEVTGHTVIALKVLPGEKNVVFHLAAKGLVAEVK